MNIALVGYGKMGKAIEKIAIEQGYNISAIISHSNQSELQNLTAENTDVAIEFTGAEYARDNIISLLKAGVPVVSGTTGWLKEFAAVEQVCTEQDGSFLYASNFSIGVNIFFAINKKLADLMNGQAVYKASIEEIHHTQKKDAPSGTAITLAEQIIDKHEGYSNWKNDEPTANNELPIKSLRIDPAPGTHTVTYESEIDAIEIKHTAHSRIGFASGAVLAAGFISSKKGIFSMSDVLGL